MSASRQQLIQEAVAALRKRNTITIGNGEFQVRELLLVESWRPHTEPCRHAGAVVIGEDACGNFFLCAPDGSVSFWNHETEEETVLAASTRKTTFETIDWRRYL